MSAMASTSLIALNADVAQTLEPSTLPGRVGAVPLAGLTCPICTDLFLDPVIVSCCGHTYCRQCLDQALAHNDACPLCRAPLLSGIDCVLPNRAVQELLQMAASRLTRSCTFADVIIDVPDQDQPDGATTAQLRSGDRGPGCSSHEDTGSTSQSQSGAAVGGSNQSGRSSSGQGARGGEGEGGQEGHLGRAYRWSLPSAHAMWVRLFLVWGARGRAGLEKVRKLRRWLMVNEARLRCCLYITLSACIMIFLRVQEEEFAVQARRLSRNPLQS